MPRVWFSSWSGLRSAKSSTRPPRFTPAMPLGQKFTLEPGYLDQYVVRNGSDRIDHTANLTPSANF